MPIYDYACTACGHELEATHGVHEEGPATCPACGGALRKRLSPPAIVFRGAGWAKNDARAAAGKFAGATSGDGKAAADDRTAHDTGPAARRGGGSSSANGTGRRRSEGGAAGTPPAGTGAEG